MQLFCHHDLFYPPCVPTPRDCICYLQSLPRITPHAHLFPSLLRSFFASHPSDFSYRPLPDDGASPDDALLPRDAPPPVAASSLATGLPQTPPPPGGSTALPSTLSCPVESWVAVASASQHPHLIAATAVVALFFLLFFPVHLALHLPSVPTSSPPGCHASGRLPPRPATSSCYSAAAAAPPNPTPSAFLPNLNPRAVATRGPPPAPPSRIPRGAFLLAPPSQSRRFRFPRLRRRPWTPQM
ncbi:hypothetical protein PVAP13_4KG180012 [Panicum virgatum]|uniref:Uncharacterized protein n=1 Tax=Panicum virgatum TaxID=38727 RepID=A0A8T0TLV9_PANVG|nr:hypothetical protein PVAP13_4KG180012 [Panicum virgatum]